MAQGDITKTFRKVQITPETGVVQYLEQQFIEDGDGNLVLYGPIHRPGAIHPITKGYDTDNPETYHNTNLSGYDLFLQNHASQATDAQKQMHHSIEEGIGLDHADIPDTYEDYTE